MTGRRLPRSARLLARQLGPRRDPMCRIEDRLEGVLLVLTLLAAVVLVLFAGWAGSHEYGSAHRTAAVQLADRHRVDAVVLDNAHPSLANASLAVVTVGWTAADWSRHTDTIEVPANAKIGEQHTLWVNRANSVVQPPMTGSDVWGIAIAAVLAVLALGGLALYGGYRLLRWLLDHSREARWDDDWARTEPHWRHRSH